MQDLRPTPDVVPLLVPSLRREIAPADDLRSLFSILRILRGWRADIVHTHMAKAGFIGRIAARLVRVPVVLHSYHGTVLSGYFDPLRSSVFTAMERAVTPLTTMVVVPSAQLRRDLLASGIARPGNVCEVSVGVDLGPFGRAARGKLRQELGIAPDVPLVGIVARLVPIKGVDLFLKAAQGVAAARPDARFVVAGDGELREVLEAQADTLGLRPRVTFLGWRADVASIYADLDVVSVTSWNEGVPIALIEAMATSRPVVATAVGGIPDVIVAGENGLLFPPGDADGIARAVVSLLSDPARAQALGDSGRRTAELYDLARYVERMERLYIDLYEGRSHG